MDLLSGSPYLLDDQTGPKIIASASTLTEEVQLLRRRGSLREETLRRLREEWGIRQVYESAGIEGNQLDMSETQMAIQRGITISGKPPEHSEEVRNLHSALGYLEELAQVNEPLSEREIKEIHGIIVGPDYKDRGAYRTVEVEITNSPHKPPTCIVVPEQMQKYVAWMAQAYNSVPAPLLAAVCHAWLVHIHPFRDGNGRTARAVMNLLLMRQGFPVVVVRRKDRQRYYEVLRRSDDCDIGPFLELLTERCHDSLTQMDRIRKASEGINIALERVRAAEERKYRIWLDGIRLMASALDDALKNVAEAAPAFSAQVQLYDTPDLDDYLALSARDISGSTWLMRLALARGAKRSAVLLWVGFSSDSLLSGLKETSAFPSVWVSMENPSGSPKWILADATFPPTPREFAFLGGRYWGRLRDGKLREYDSVVTLASDFVASLIEGWFA